jgi:hypothetical protein
LDALALDDLRADDGVLLIEGDAAARCSAAIEE